MTSLGRPQKGSPSRRCPIDNGFSLGLGEESGAQDQQQQPEEIVLSPRSRRAFHGKVASAPETLAQPPRSRQVAVSHGSLQARLTSPQKIGGFPGLCFGTAQVGQAPRTPRAETSHLGDIPGVSGFFHGLGVFDAVDPRSFVAPQSTFQEEEGSMHIAKPPMQPPPPP
ncbi:hypothetical protein CH63R_02436 [Colletotrichum higginsianum IMI 349063]|uniref:Uncharacterized protein n=1 Tax=Colletotrichum higginsianum (strain IMI 349063) TaxID=759273 RepID=A0A1B7YNU4_COLHI|nr:hypothetical protein CH63R_02436 [Colletotrichum higginsianum IMI 349063]OBR13710.1 hypothetical protein CH63R_02436 [Colletotrichum higginsianum IMI 349063]